MGNLCGRMDEHIKGYGGQANSMEKGSMCLMMEEPSGASGRTEDEFGGFMEVISNLWRSFMKVERPLLLSADHILSKD